MFVIRYNIEYSNVFKCNIYTGWSQHCVSLFVNRKIHGIKTEGGTLLNYGHVTKPLLSLLFWDTIVIISMAIIISTMFTNLTHHVWKTFLWLTELTGFQNRFETIFSPYKLTSVLVLPVTKTVSVSINENFQKLWNTLNLSG